MSDSEGDWDDFEVAVAPGASDHIESTHAEELAVEMAERRIVVRELIRKILMKFKYYNILLKYILKNRIDIEDSLKRLALPKGEGLSMFDWVLISKMSREEYERVHEPLEKECLEIVHGERFKESVMPNMNIIGAEIWSELSHSSHDGHIIPTSELKKWTFMDTLKFLNDRDLTKELMKRSKVSKPDKKMKGKPKAGIKVKDLIYGTHLENLIKIVKMGFNGINKNHGTIEELVVHMIVILKKINRIPGVGEAASGAGGGIVRDLSEMEIFRYRLAASRLIGLIDFEQKSRVNRLKEAIRGFNLEMETAANKMAVRFESNGYQIIHPKLKDNLIEEIEEFDRRTGFNNSEYIQSLIEKYPRVLLEPVMKWAQTNSLRLFRSQTEFMVKFIERDCKGLFLHPGSTGSGKTTLVSKLLTIPKKRFVVFTPCSATASQILAPILHPDPTVISYVVASRTDKHPLVLTAESEAKRAIGKMRYGKRKQGEKMTDGDKASEISSDTVMYSRRSISYEDKLNNSRMFFVSDPHVLAELWHRLEDDKDNFVLIVDDPGAADEDGLTALGLVLRRPPGGVVMLSATLPNPRTEIMMNLLKKLYPEQDSPVIVETLDATTGTMICDLEGYQVIPHETCKTSDDVIKIINLIKYQSALQRFPNPRIVAHLGKLMRWMSDEKTVQELAFEEAKKGPVLQTFWTEMYIRMLNDLSEFENERIEEICSSKIREDMIVPRLGDDIDLIRVVSEKLFEGTIVATNEPVIWGYHLLDYFMKPFIDGLGEKAERKSMHEIYNLFIKELFHYPEVLAKWQKDYDRLMDTMKAGRADARRSGGKEASLSDGDISDKLERSLPLPKNPLNKILPKGLVGLDIDPLDEVWKDDMKIGLLLFLGIGVIWKDMPKGMFFMIVENLRNGNIRYLIADNSVAYGLNIPCNGILIMNDFAKSENLATLIQVAGRPGRLGKGDAWAGYILGHKIVERIREISSEGLFEDQARLIGLCIDRAEELWFKSREEKRAKKKHFDSVMSRYSSSY